MYCKWCGTENEQGALFCKECRACLPDEMVQQVVTPKKNGIKIIAVVVAGIILLSVTAVAYRFIPKNMSVASSNYEEHPVVYVKEDRVYLKDGKKDAVAIADAYGYFESGDREYYKSNWESVYSDGFECFTISEDGNIMFFIDDYIAGECDLYYRTRNYDGDAGIKIASGVTNFKIDPDGKRVIYQKNDQLYVSDLKEVRTIDSDVFKFWLSKDGTKVLYSNNDGDLYLCDLKQDEGIEIIDNTVITVQEKEPNFETIYYTKTDGTAFKKQVGKDKVLLGENYDVWVKEINGAYIMREYETIELTFDELFIDDCAHDFEIIEEPIVEDFFYEDDNGEEIIDYDAYEIAQNDYEAKCERDMIRNYYRKKPYESSHTTIYKIEGEDFVEIKNNIVDIIEIRNNTFSNNEVDTWIIGEVNDYKKIKLSEARNLNSVEYSVANPICTYYVLTSKGEVVPIDDSINAEAGEGKIAVSADEKYLYYIKEDADTETLMRREILKNELANEEVIRENVLEFMLYDGFILVYNYDESGILEDGNYVKFEGNVGNYIMNMGDVLYYQDNYSPNSKSGSCKRYKDGVTEELGVDAAQIVPRSEDVCYYIADYSSNSEIGELYLYKNGKSEKIDSDVSFIVY